MKNISYLTRYAKGTSQTMQTLKNLRFQILKVFSRLLINKIKFIIIRKRGVKVELGIPEDLWDEPSAEITQLKKYVTTIKTLD